jgi:hypothetical protein
VKEFKANLNGHIDDYTTHRTKANKAPISFRVTEVQEIKNQVLAKRFEKCREALKANGRSDEELKVRFGFHGTFESLPAGVPRSITGFPAPLKGTRPSNIAKIARYGLLRIGHPLNPSESTDEGWFGSPKHGVYLSRYADYTLKYSNDLAPLEPAEGVEIIMFKVVCVVPCVCPRARTDSSVGAAGAG